MEVYEEKYEPPIELQRTNKIILTQEEYDNLKTAFCKGKGGVWIILTQLMSTL